MQPRKVLENIVNQLVSEMMVDDHQSIDSIKKDIIQQLAQLGISITNDPLQSNLVELNELKNLLFLNWLSIPPQYQEMKDDNVNNNQTPPFQMFGEEPLNENIPPTVSPSKTEISPNPLSEPLHISGADSTLFNPSPIDEVLFPDVTFDHGNQDDAHNRSPLPSLDFSTNETISNSNAINSPVITTKKPRRSHKRKQPEEPSLISSGIAIPIIVSSHNDELFSNKIKLLNQIPFLFKDSSNIGDYKRYLYKIIFKINVLDSDNLPENRMELNDRDLTIIYIIYAFYKKNKSTIACCSSNRMYSLMEKLGYDKNSVTQSLNKLTILEFITKTTSTVDVFYNFLSNKAKLAALTLDLVKKREAEQILNTTPEKKQKQQHSQQPLNQPKQNQLQHTPSTQTQKKTTQAMNSPKKNYTQLQQEYNSLSRDFNQLLEQQRTLALKKNSLEQKNTELEQKYNQLLEQHTQWMQFFLNTMFYAAMPISNNNLLSETGQQPHSLSQMSMFAHSDQPVGINNSNQKRRFTPNQNSSE